jgi:hypothetical protein
LDISLGLLEQWVAPAGRPVVAVTVDFVMEEHKEEPEAEMYEAQEFDSGFVQARTAGNSARRA